MGYVSKITTGTDIHPVGSALYGTCTTAAATAAKEVACSDFDTLIEGVSIHVKFTNSNTASDPTMNVNNTGAKPIYRYGTTAPLNTDSTSWKAGSVITFTYDGNAWQMNNWGNAGTLTKIQTGVGLTGGAITTDGEIKVKLKQETRSSLASVAISEVGAREYGVHPDANGNLAVNVPWKDDNTKYRFTSGTNSFTAISTDGDQQTVLVTPFIQDNITGLGKANSFAMFDGENSIINGLEIGNDDKLFLRNDGTWADPKIGDIPWDEIFEDVTYSEVEDAFIDELLYAATEEENNEGGE